MRIAEAVLVVAPALLLAFALRNVLRARRPTWKAVPHTINGRYVIRLEKYGEEPVEVASLDIHAGNYDQLKAQAETRAYELVADWNATDRGLSR